MMDQNEQLTDYLSGRNLYGDDFSESEIAGWYEDEAEAYAGLGAADRDSYSYGYHALNRQLGFSYLGERTFKHALGSAVHMVMNSCQSSRGSSN